MNVKIISKSDVKKLINDEIRKLEPKIYQDFNRSFLPFRNRMIKLETRIEELENEQKRNNR